MFSSSSNIKFPTSFLYLLSLLCLFSCKSIPQPNKSDGLLLKQLQANGLNSIAFGSCSDQDKNQVLWPEILKHKPELWIWLGDNIYADTENMKLMRKMYDKQKSDPNYQKLISSSAIIGTWDDHDFGVNDGGKEYPKKQESQNLLLDFLDVPMDAPCRKRAGVYQSYTFGKKVKKTKIILLDCRYFRDEAIKTDTGYLTKPGADILGEAQWKWFEKELMHSDASVNIIASGIQVIPEQHRFEKWANFPKAHDRLYNLVAKSKAKNVIFITGDRHMAEISKRKLPQNNQIIYDITSSALTNPRSTDAPEENRYRIGKNFNAINFAVLHLNWKKNAPEIWVELRGKENKLVAKEMLNF